MKRTRLFTASPFRVAMAAGLFVLFAAVNPYSPMISDQLQQLLDNLSTWQEERPEDKVYLQLDRPFYKPGETLWFTAYVREGVSLKPSRRSDILHVEFIDPKGSVAQSHRLILKNGMGEGDFTLAAAAPGGIYKVKAYTKWMENDEQPAIFEKEVQVQAVVTPRVKMKLDFVREAYGEGAEVEADVRFESLTNQPIANREVSYQLQVEGRLIKAGTAKTDGDGKVRVGAKLPDQLETPDALLIVMLNHQGIMESISRSVPVVLRQVDLSFFPEGGDLVEGLPGRVAFKAVNAYGEAADIAGVVLDDRGKVVARLSSYHKGMGAFDLTPQAGQSYRVALSAPFISEPIYPIPAAMKRGYALRVNQVTEDVAKLSIYSTEQEALSVVATVRGKAYFAQEIQAKPGESQITVSLRDLPMGVAQFTLFDSRVIPRAERLAFVNGQRQMKIEVETDKEKYLPREKVTLKVRTLDDRGMPLPAHVSLAVVDDRLRSFADDRSSTILSWMLVESDIQGEVEDPRFYFDPSEEKAPLALDYLLMTAGWRRFSWRQIAEQTLPSLAHQPEQARVKGKLLDLQGLPLVGVQVSADGIVTRTDQQGAFEIRDLDLYQPAVLSFEVQGSDLPYLYQVGTYRDDLEIQVGKLSGMVQSEDGSPFPGATVTIPGTNLGAYTDEKGRYSLSVGSIDKGNVALRVSAIGYESQEFLLPAQQIASSVLNVQMQPNFVMLNEVMAVGNVRSARSQRGERELARNRPAAAQEGWDDKMLPMAAAPAQEEKAPDVVDFIGVGVVPMDEEPNLKFEIDMDDAEDKRKKQLGAPIIAPNAGPKEQVADMPMAGLFLGTTPVTSGGFYRAREFAAPAYVERSIPKQRSDFRQTLHWGGKIETDRRGEATITFFTSDALTAFHVTVEGIGMEGSIGRQEFKFFSQLPFELDLRIPSLLTALDTIQIPLTLINNTDERVSGPISIRLPKHLLPLSTFPSEISLNAREARTILLPCRVDTLISTDSIAVDFRADGFADAIVLPVTNAPRGFPASEAFTSEKTDATFSTDLTQAVPGSLRMKFSAFPSVSGEVLQGLEGMLREPHGCFEQTSSSTYPNVLILSYLRETEQDQPSIATRASSLIQTGYQRLMTFESKSGGFEWFGQDPGHEALTAYGLMEFVDMAKVYDGVDKAMIDRTAKWLMDRRDGKGGFQRNPRALHTFGLADDATTSIYIAYALSEAGYKDLSKEADFAYETALASKRPHQVALAANLLINLGQEARGKALLDVLVSEQQTTGQWLLDEKQRSAPGSGGQGLHIETTGLAMMAMLKTKGYDSRVINKAAEWLRSQRSAHGDFGNCHATVVALRALIEFAQQTKKIGTDGSVEILVGNKVVAERNFLSDDREPILLEGLEAHLSATTQQLTVRFRGVETPMPYTLALTYATDLPPSDAACVIAVTPTFTKNSVKMGETLRMTVRVVNKSQEGQPMTMAIVGIPGGLSPQPWQLKEMVDRKEVDFYEIIGQDLVLYYRQMTPGQQHTLSFDLKAEVPGEFTAQASRGYLYYTNEHKHWTKMPTISVLPN